MNATLEYKKKDAQNIYSFWFRPNSQLHYIAGQFIQLQIPIANSVVGGNKRRFTLSSAPTEKLVSITTRINPINASPFKQALAKLELGSSVKLSDAMGDFVLPQKTEIPIIMIAGGIGITPMRSIIKWLVDNRERRNIKLLYATSTYQSVAFRDLFENAPIDFSIILSRPPVNWTGQSGRLSADNIIDLSERDKNTLIYVSGPEPMVKSLHSNLVLKGIAEYRIVTDCFIGYRSKTIQ